MPPRRLGALLGASLVLLSLGAAPVAGLTCVEPESDWAKLEVVDLDRDETVAQVPFEGHSRGYGCGIGNTHDIHADRLAWMSADNGTEDRVHVLDLTTGEATSFPTNVTSPESISITSDHVLLLAGSDGGEVTVRVIDVDPATGVEGRRDVTMLGGEAVLHGPVIQTLTRHDGKPELIVYDIVRDLYLHSQTDLPRPGDGPVSLLGGDGEWIVLATGGHGDVGRNFLDEDARVWALDPLSKERIELPPPGGHGEPRFGVQVEFDRGTVHTPLWQAAATWGPGKILTYELPTGSQSTEDPDGLIDGIALDRGLFVTGSRLDGPPDDPAPRIDRPLRVRDDAEPADEGEPGSAPATPAPSLALTAGLVTLAAAILRRR